MLTRVHQFAVYPLKRRVVSTGLRLSVLATVSNFTFTLTKTINTDEFDKDNKKEANLDMLPTFARVEHISQTQLRLLTLCIGQILF